MFKHIFLNQTVIHLFYYYEHTENYIWQRVLLVYGSHIQNS